MTLTTSLTAFYLFCNHSQLLEVDQSFYHGVIGQVNESQVLFDHRVEGDDWGLDVVGSHQVSIPNWKSGKI